MKHATTLFLLSKNQKQQSLLSSFSFVYNYALFDLLFVKPDLFGGAVKSLFPFVDPVLLRGSCKNNLSDRSVCLCRQNVVECSFGHTFNINF
jgi:hypothetical protein